MDIVLALLAGVQTVSESASSVSRPPAPPAAIAAPAEPRAPLQNYITAYDRPPSVPSEQLNKVTVKLAIGPYGRITDCLIAKSSGSDALDAATCLTLVRRARFTPARDSSGNPVADMREQEIEWRPE